MGQICGPSVLCDLDKVDTRDDRRDRWSSQAPDEAAKKMDQLSLELRMLKDENYRIREDQLRLEKEMKARGLARDGSFVGVGLPGERGSRGGSFVNVGMGNDRGSFTNVGGRSSFNALGEGFAGYDPRSSWGQGPASSSNLRASSADPQVSYMKEVIRTLQAENSRLRRATAEVPIGASAGGMRDQVSEEEYLQLQRQLKSLQQAHLRQVQQQVRSGHGSATASTAVSGTASPLSSQTPLMSQDTRALQAQYEALQQEQEMLRSKVRRLAHNG